MVVGKWWVDAESEKFNSSEKSYLNVLVHRNPTPSDLVQNIIELFQ
jgi:hypothetical protein